MNIVEQAKTYNWATTNVRFRQDTELGHLVKRIEERVLLNIPAGITNDELKTVIINNLSTYLMETEDGRADMARLSDYGLRMAEMFAESLNTLKGRAADEVSHLSTKIMSLAEEQMMSRVGFVDVDGVLTPTPSTYITLKIDDLESSLESSLKDLMTRFQISVNSFNAATCKYFLDKLPKCESLNLGDETDRILSEMKSKLNTEDDEKTKSCLRIFNAVITSQGYEDLYRYLFGHGIYSGKINEDGILAALGFCRNYSTFKKAVENSSFDFAEETKVQFEKNLSVLKDMYTICCCVLELTRQKYKDRLIIGKTLLNGDEFTKFEENGGTTEDITNHLRLHYNDKENDIFYSMVGHQTFPINGIGTKEVMIAMADNNVKLDKFKAEAKLQMLNQKQSCTQSAFSSVLKNYIYELNSNSDILPDNEEKPRFIQRAIDQVNLINSMLSRNSQTSVEDAVYNFYLNVWMKDSLASTIYYKMGAEVITQLNHTTNADEEFLSKIHVSVMSDILTSYMTSAFLIKG